MRGYTVYRVDYVTGRKEPIGCVLDRSYGTKERKLVCLLLEARRYFAAGHADAFHIALDPGGRESSLLTRRGGDYTLLPAPVGMKGGKGSY